jgi:nitrogen fixation protein FixH
MCCCGVFIMPTELIDDGDGREREREPGSARQPFRFKGRHALALFIGFFGLIATVNATMLTLAIRTMPGLDARNGYDPSQRFNAEARLAAERKARGWRADADVSLSGGVAALAFALRTREGAAIDEAQVMATLRHPSDRRRDRAVSLEALGDGHYAGKADGVAPGAWDLMIEARSGVGGDIVFASRQRIDLKG